MSRFLIRTGRSLCVQGRKVVTNAGSAPCVCDDGGGGGGPGCACCELDQGPCAWQKCFGETTRVSVSGSATGAVGTVVYTQGQNQTVFQHGAPTVNASIDEDFTVTGCLRTATAGNTIEQNIGTVGGCTDVHCRTDLTIGSGVNFFNQFRDREDQKQCNIIAGPKLLQGQLLEIDVVAVAYITNATCPPGGGLNGDPNGATEATMNLRIAVNLDSGVWHADMHGSRLFRIRNQGGSQECTDDPAPKDPGMTGTISVTRQGGRCGGIVQFAAEVEESFVDPFGDLWKTAMKVAGSVRWETGLCGKDGDLEPLFPGNAPVGPVS